MILIADSGSTKTHWTLSSPTGVELDSFYTDGLNPFYRNEEGLYNVVYSELLPSLKDRRPTAVFFYGAGCSQPDKVARVVAALKKAFPASAIMVDHDLMGAARATCGKEPGIACILGTGSNSCLFDGTVILDNVPSLGFTLGDEGSGGDLGRKLLKAFFYREFPADLDEKIRAGYNMSKEYVLNQVYEGELPNQYVASFARFISENNHHPFINQLVYDGFREFLQRMVMKYQGSHHLPVHFIGSIAELNKDILAKALADFGLTLGVILKSPSEGLVKFHTN